MTKPTKTEKPLYIMGRVRLVVQDPIPEYRRMNQRTNMVSAGKKMEFLTPEQY